MTITALGKLSADFKFFLSNPRSAGTHCPGSAASPPGTGVGVVPSRTPNSLRKMPGVTPESGLTVRVGPLAGPVMR